MAETGNPLECPEFSLVSKLYVRSDNEDSQKCNSQSELFIKETHILQSGTEGSVLNCNGNNYAENPVAESENLSTDIKGIVGTDSKGTVDAVIKGTVDADIKSIVDANIKSIVDTNAQNCKGQSAGESGEEDWNGDLREFQEFSDKLEQYVADFDEVHGLVKISDLEDLTIDIDHPDGNQNEIEENVSNKSETVSNGITKSMCESGFEMWRSTNGRTFEKLLAKPKNMQISFHECDINYFDFIPVELIMKIFSYLSTQELCRHVSPVCRLWRQLSLDHSLWKYIDFSSCPYISSLNFLWIIRRAPLLQRINLSGRHDIKRAEVAIFTECCPGLQEIDFGFCDNLTGDMIKTVSENCKSLQRLNVEGCEKLDQRAVRYMARCKKLKRLNFSHCFFQDAAINYLTEKLNNITCINLDGIADITDSAVVKLVSKHKDHLLELELDGAEISDISIEQIVKCKKLKLLGISFCECLTDQALVFLQTLKNLETLRLRKGTDLSAKGLLEFFKGACLVKLQSLNLTECSHIVDETVLAMVQKCGKSLRELSLGWCWFITDTGLISIVDHCCTLENLDLLGIDKIRGECLERIPEEIPNLRFLDLRQCNQINDALIMDVVRRKPDLKVYNYYGEEFIYSAG